MKKLIVGSVFFGISSLGFGAACFADTSVPSKAKDATTKVVAPSPMVVSQRVGSWNVRCVYPAITSADKDQKVVQGCVGQQVLTVQSKEGQSVPVASILLEKMQATPHKGGKAAQPFKFTVATPLGLSLKEPIVFTPEHGSAMSLSWSMCLQNGCIATTDLTSSLIQELETSKTGHLVIHRVNGTTLTINFDLKDVGQVTSTIDQLMTKKAP